MAQQQVEIGNLLRGFMNILDDGNASMQQSARLIAREGCVVAGRVILKSVKRHAPVLKGSIFSPFQVTPSRAKYSFAPGELRNALYFTNSKAHFNWRKGQLSYIVGMPHGKKGQVTPGWYAHFVEFGHKRRNWIVVNEKTGWVWPKKTDGRGKGVKQLIFQRVPPTPFMAHGIAAVESAVPNIMVNAMKKQMGIEVAKLALRFGR